MQLHTEGSGAKESECGSNGRMGVGGGGMLKV